MPMTTAALHAGHSADMAPVPASSRRLWLVAALFGLLIGWAAFNYLESLFRDVGRFPIAWFIGAVILAAMGSRLLLAHAWPRLKAYPRSQRVVWLTGSLMAGVALMVAVPLPAVPACAQLEIT